MSDQMLQGLQIGIVGMGLTFLALTVLILSMILLDRLFKRGGKAPAQQAVRQGRGRPAESAARVTEMPEEEVVVAITMALAHLGYQVAERGSLGETLAEEKGAWWKRGGSFRLMPRFVRRQDGDPS